MNGGPQLFDSGSGFCGAKHYRFRLEGLAEGGVSVDASVAGELVGFGGGDDESPAGVAEEVKELNVGLLWRDIAVHQAQAEGEGGLFREIWLDKFWPLGGDGFGDFGIAVSGQVGEVHLWLLALRRAGDRKEVDGAGASRSG